MVATFIAVAGLAAGCGATVMDVGPGASGAFAGELSGRTFLSTSVTESGKPRALADGTQISVEITEDGRLLVNAGCNTMSGLVDVSGGRISAPELAVTGLGCDAPRHTQDEWLAAIIAARPTWRLDADNLVLSSGATQIVLLDRKLAQPDLALQATKWVVDTVIDGDTASSIAVQSPATLVFGPGQVQVFAGCNSGSGSYQLTQRQLTFGELALTRKACEPELMQFEQSVLAALSGVVAFEIEADRLTLKHPSGKGLQLKGERE